MEFLVLGPLEVREGGWPIPLRSGKELTLLGLLLLHANEPVSVERILDGLWGPRPPASAVKLVQGYVGSLRRRLGADRLLTRPRGYAIRVEEGELDADRFERLVSEARGATPEAAARRLRAALALWRGRPLANVRIEDPTEFGIERLDEQRLATLIERIDADLALGRHASLIGELETMIAERPLTERLRAQLMLALYRSGRQADALAVYRETRRMLADEVGIDPSRELKALESGILNQDPSLELEPRPSPVRKLDLPDALQVESPFPFVGRTRELALLRELLARAAEDGRQTALVGGEAGSGKTRLVREFAREAAADGALVLYGACDPVVRTPYRAVVQALAPLVGREGAAGAEDDWLLRRLLPDPPPTADPDTERLRLHTAVADLLEEASRRRRVLLVLEDGHWADTPTLLFLRHLARAAPNARMLVLATFRDTEAEVPAQLADALVDLRRLDDAVRLRLEGLSRDDVASFLATATPRDADPSELADALWQLTGGNAFLLCELWRTLVESDAVAVEEGRLRLERPVEQIASPQSVREVVSRRVAALPPETRALLELAAVVGPEVELEVLLRAAPAGLDGLHALEPAERAGLIEPIPPGLAHRFTHELVRRALYDGLASVRRAELHLRIAETLEERGHGGSDHGVADLAHHFAAAAALGERDRAIDYNLRAARLAMESFAFKEAAARLEAGLAIGVGDERRRADTLLELGTASFRAGELPRSLEAYREAARLAREIGDAELLARAALGLEDAYRRGNIVAEGVVDLLEEASAAVGANDSPLRVRVLAALARALSLGGDPTRGGVVRESAIAIARRLGDRHGLAAALMNAYWARGSTPPEAIAEMMVEASDLAGELGELELQAEAILFSVSVLSALGDMAAVRDRQARALEAARRLRQPYILHAAEQHGSALALLEGRLAAAEAAAENAREWGAMLTGPPADAAYGIQMFGIRREQGRLPELAPAAEALSAGDIGAGMWRPAFAALLAELGLHESVQRELARAGEDGLDRLRHGLWLASLTYLTDACTAIGDRQTAALVYPELAAYEGTNVVVGYSVAYYGAADRYLGMLAATLGERTRAERHFAAAHALNRRMGARTWLAHGCFEHGRMLLASGEPARAAPLLAEATALAEGVGMPALLARIRTLAFPPVAASRPQPGLSERETDVLRLVARGRSNREIGAALRVSEHTVANHVRSILRKTGTANRTEATAYAHQHGLVELQRSE